MYSFECVITVSNVQRFYASQPINVYTLDVILYFIRHLIQSREAALLIQKIWGPALLPIRRLRAFWTSRITHYTLQHTFKHSFVHSFIEARKSIELKIESDFSTSTKNKRKFQPNNSSIRNRCRLKHAPRVFSMKLHLIWFHWYLNQLHTMPNEQ